MGQCRKNQVPIKTPVLEGLGIPAQLLEKQWSFIIEPGNLNNTSFFVVEKIRINKRMLTKSFGHRRKFAKFGVNVPKYEKVAPVK